MMEKRLADIIIYNVHILTMDDATPFATGLVIADGKILSLLKNSQYNDWPLKKDGQLIDGQGKTLMPGLIDAHLHLKGMISQYSSIDFHQENIKSIHDIITIIHKKSTSIPKNNWIRAMNYDIFNFDKNRHPRRWDLDEATCDHPVRLRHVTRHLSVLNSLALELAGITHQTPDPPNVKVERDPYTNEPTGLIFGGDSWLSTNIVPPLSETDLSNGTNLLKEDLLSKGIVAVQDATPTNNEFDINFWSKKILDGWPISIQLMASHDRYAAIKKIWSRDLSDQIKETLSIGHVKVVIESAKGLQPDLEQLTNIATDFTKQSIPLAIHVVEPEMISIAIEAIKQAQQATNKCLRHRFEHLSLCPDAFLEDMDSLNISVVTNPSLIYDHGDRYLCDVEPTFHSWIYRMNSLIQSNISLAAGSDAPVATYNPWIGIYVANTRHTVSGQTLVKEEALTRYQSLKLYTNKAAKVGNLERSHGKIAPGYDADFILLKHNPLHCSANELKNMDVFQTWIKGQCVFERSL